MEYRTLLQIMQLVKQSKDQPCSGVAEPTTELHANVKRPDSLDGANRLNPEVLKSAEVLT